MWEALSVHQMTLKTAEWCSYYGVSSDDLYICFLVFSATWFSVLLAREVYGLLAFPVMLLSRCAPAFVWIFEWGKELFAYYHSCYVFRGRGVDDVPVGGEEPSPVGEVFVRRGQAYVRGVAGKTFELTTTGFAVNPTGPFAPLVEQFSVSEVSSESVVSMCDGGMVDCIETTPKWFVEVGLEKNGTFVPFMQGWREGFALVVPRHGRAAPLSPGFGAVNVCLRCNKTTVRDVKIDRSFTLDAPKHFKTFERTGYDLEALFFPPGVFSELGCPSVTSAVYLPRVNVDVKVFGRVGPRLKVSKGTIGSSLRDMRHLGTTTHTADTLPGFSGSPVVTVKNGTPYICGMHICGDYEGNRQNHCITVPALRHFLREAGLHKVAKAIIPGFAFSETSTDSDSAQAEPDAVYYHLQNEWAQEEYEQDAFQNARDVDDRDTAAEELRNELMHGGRGAYRTSRGVSDVFSHRESALNEHADAEEESFEDAPVKENEVARTEVPAPVSVEDVIEESTLSPSPTPFIEQPESRPVVFGMSVKVREVKKVRRAGELGCNVTTGKVLSFEKSDMEGFLKTGFARHVDECVSGGDYKDITDEELQGAAVTYLYELGADAKERADNCLAALQKLEGVDPRRVYNCPVGMQFRNYMDAGEKKWETPEVVESFSDSRGNVAARVVGSVSAKCGKAKSTVTVMPEDVKKIALEAAAAVGYTPNLDFVLPPTTAPAVVESLAGQFLAQTPGSYATFSGKAVDRAEALADTFPRCRLSGDTHVKAVEKAFNAFDLSRSQAWSGRYKNGTKAAWKKVEDLQEMAYLVRFRMLMRAVVGVGVTHMSAAEQVKLGLMDPRECFNKPELHGTAKAAEKRWRVVWGISLPDAILQSLLHKDQNVGFISAYQEAPATAQVLSGMGHHDAGHAAVVAALQRLRETGEMGDSDAKGWDLSVARDGIVLDAFRRVAQVEVADGLTSEHMLYLTQLLSEAFCNSAHVIAVGKKLLEVCYYGITASGIVSTTAQNCFIRLLLLLIFGAADVIDLGDDEVHSGVVDYAGMAVAGVTTKGTGAQQDGTRPAEFTSHSYEADGKVTFLNVDKTVARVLFGLEPLPEGGFSIKPDVVKGVRFALRTHAEGTAYFEKVLELVGVSIPGSEQPFYTEG